jgi:folate-binding protein YgfZ
MTEGQNLGIKSKKILLCVRGRDAKRFLNGMLTADFSNALEQAPSCGRSFLLTSKGRILCEVFFYCPSPLESWLIVRPEDEAILYSTLQKYLIADQVEILDPKEIEVLSLFRSEFHEVQRIQNRHVLGQEKNFKAFQQGKNIILPLCLISPTHVEVICGDDFHLEKINFLEFTQDQFWNFYFEAGQPLWGRDLLADDLILEFPLSDAISFDKGCYVGQETVARGTFRGKVNKVFARFEGGFPLGDLLNDEGEVIAHIRSSLKGRSLGLMKISALEKKQPYKIEALVNEKTYRGNR